VRLIVADRVDGKSCLVEERVLEHPGEGMSVLELTELPLVPPSVRPAGVSEYRDLGVPVGSVRMLRARFRAGEVRPPHFTNTIDCHTVVDGEISLLLDDGDHLLRAGDSAVVRGVDHGWRVGAAGCLVSILLLGTPGPCDELAPTAR
jgi:quercetin dioxygenase-like cupin family protein